MLVLHLNHILGEGKKPNQNQVCEIARQREMEWWEPLTRRPMNKSQKKDINEKAKTNEQQKQMKEKK